MVILLILTTKTNEPVDIRVENGIDRRTSEKIFHAKD